MPRRNSSAPVSEDQMAYLAVRLPKIQIFEFQLRLLRERKQSPQQFLLEQIQKFLASEEAS